MAANEKAMAFTTSATVIDWYFQSEYHWQNVKHNEPLKHQVNFVADGIQKKKKNKKKTEKISLDISCGLFGRQLTWNVKTCFLWKIKKKKKKSKLSPAAVMISTLKVNIGVSVYMRQVWENKMHTKILTKYVCACIWQMVKTAILYTIYKSTLKKTILNQRINGHVNNLKLYVLNKLMVTFLKTETYGYGSLVQFEKPLVSVTWYGI